MWSTQTSSTPLRYLHPVFSFPGDLRQAVHTQVEMSDGGAAPQPQVFVVDSQASCVPVHAGRRPGRSAGGQKLLLALVGLAMLGLVVQASLIYDLYRKMETFSHCVPHPFCQNCLSPETPGQQVGTLSLVGSKDRNVSTVKVSVEQILKRPFAQLIGSNRAVKEDNVVHWEHTGGEASTSRMNYSGGQLQVQEEGYYYLYSKLTLNASEQCKLVQHKVMKVTRAYGKPIELMRSKSYRCAKTRTSTSKSPEEDLQNSFLAGIFHLQREDKIYVTLEDIQKLHKGVTDNVLGAFMIAS